MRCSRIKQNCYRVRVCKGHTQYHILGLLGSLSSHIVDLGIGKVLLPLRMLLLTGSLSQLSGGTILSHVTWQSTLKTCAKSLTSLRGGILLELSCRMRNLLHILPRLLHNWVNYLLLGTEHGISGMLHLKVGKLGTLVLELRTWDLHRCMTQKLGSNKLTGLRKAGPSVASRILT
jgi:hypothetical protein